MQLKQYGLCIFILSGYVLSLHAATVSTVRAYTFSRELSNANKFCEVVIRDKKGNGLHLFCNPNMTMGDAKEIVAGLINEQVRTGDIVLHAGGRRPSDERSVCEFLDSTRANNLRLHNMTFNPESVAKADQQEEIKAMGESSAQAASTSSAPATGQAAVFAVPVSPAPTNVVTVVDRKTQQKKQFSANTFGQLRKQLADARGQAVRDVIIYAPVSVEKDPMRLDLFLNADDRNQVLIVE